MATTGHAQINRPDPGSSAERVIETTIKCDPATTPLCAARHRVTSFVATNPAHNMPIAKCGYQYNRQ
jgi:hypothetical protein